MGCHFLLQGIFLTQGLNPGLLHCRQMLYHLSYQGSPSSIACSPPKIQFPSSTLQVFAFTHFTLLHPFPLVTAIVFSLFFVCLFIYFALPFFFWYSTYELNHMVFVFLYLTYSFSMISSSSIQVAANVKISPSYGCEYNFVSVQLSRPVVSDSLDPMNRSTPGLPVHHHLPEFTQTHVH